MLEKLREIAARYDALQTQLSDPSVYGNAERLRVVNQELKELTPVVDQFYPASRLPGSDRNR